MVKPLHERTYSPLDIDKDWDKVQARIAAEIDEIGKRGSGITYHDPELGDRLVREYPDGRKVFIVRDKQGVLREVALEPDAKAA